jgi:curved DNA-binding protein CbpA
MSSGAAGKLQDHYALLGVETNADSATIQAVYTKLAQKYHPDNGVTGDQAKFDAVNLAYEVLCDPELRASFDKVKGVDLESGNPKFTGPGFFRALAESAALRDAILCILYDRRRVKSFRPSLSLRHLEGMLQVTTDELNFALWYIKQRGFAIPDDKSSMEITVEGMDYLESNRPTPESVMRFIKQDALLNPPLAPQLPPQPPPPQAPPVEKRSDEPVMNVLSRAILRHSASEETQARAALRK